MIGIGIGLGKGVVSFVGLLDSYPTASMAYSLRKLRGNYSGPAIQVRRSIDNNVLNIGFTALGNLDTTALTSFCGAGDGFVTTWYDQSVNGNNATQPTAANQPQIVSSGSVLLENSKPSLYHPANKEWFLFATQVNTINFTVLWVSRRLTTSGSSSIILNGVGYLGDDVNNDGTPNGSNQVTSIIGTSLGNTSTSGLQTTQHLSYVNKRNTTQAVGQFNNSNNPYNNSVHPNFIGFHAIAMYGPGYSYAGFIQEMIVYTNDQSANRTRISSNINTYYAIY